MPSARFAKRFSDIADKVPGVQQYVGEQKRVRVGPVQKYTGKMFPRNGVRWRDAVIAKTFGCILEQSIYKEFISINHVSNDTCGAFFSSTKFIASTLKNVDCKMKLCQQRSENQSHIYQT